MKYIFPHFLLVTIMLLMLSCHERKYVHALEYADSIMESAPDSAYQILSSLSDSVEQFDTKDRMMYYTLLGDACNKLYKPLPSDTILNEVVDYYDSHGSANQQMKSRYLLGCYHRDNNDAPEALKHYQEAVECADTLDSECDFVTLYRIYGQMAEIYYFQYLPEKSIGCLKNYSHYAYKCGDDYNYVKGIELQMARYELLKDTVKVFELADSTYSLYMNYGMPDKAARVYPMAIYMALGRKDYNKAKSMMDVFERESGAWKNDSLINKNFSRYYYAKGLYCLGTGHLENAETYFRRLLLYGHNYECYKGLFDLYITEGKSDSIIKYGELKDDAYEDIFSAMQTQSSEQVSAMYDYDKLRDEITTHKIEAYNAKLTLWMVLLTGIAVFVFLYLIYNRFKLRKRMDFERLSKDYNLIIEQLNKTEKDLYNIRQSYNSIHSNNPDNHLYLHEIEKIISEKEQESDNLKKRISNIYAEKGTISVSNRIQLLESTETVIQMRNYLRHCSDIPIIEDSFRKELINNAGYILPTHFVHIISCDSLNLQERFISILLILNFSSKEIATLLNTSESNVSNLKKSINIKLFGDNTAKTLILNLKMTLNPNRSSGRKRLFK